MEKLTERERERESGCVKKKTKKKDENRRKRNNIRGRDIRIFLAYLSLSLSLSFTKIPPTKRQKSFRQLVAIEDVSVVHLIGSFKTQSRGIRSRRGSIFPKRKKTKRKKKCPLIVVTIKYNRTLIIKTPFHLLFHEWPTGELPSLVRH